MRIRSLGDGDVDVCVALARTVAWRTDERWWRAMLRLGEGFGIVRDGGELIGTVIVNHFGVGLATIAMMIVHPAHQRRGHGRRLMARALENAKGALVYLFATDDGRALYEPLGFVAGGASVRLEGLAKAGLPE